MLDIPLFDDLRKLHERGFFLNYEFAYVCLQDWLRTPLSRLISNWEKRWEFGPYHTYFDPVFYSWELAGNIDNLEPTCSCRASKADNKNSAAIVEDNHRADCDGYLPGICGECTNQWLSSKPTHRLGNNTDAIIYGHTNECTVLQ